jgi:hypothetical protein
MAVELGESGVRYRVRAWTRNVREERGAPVGGVDLRRGDVSPIFDVWA